VLQAAVGAITDSLAKAINRFSIHGHDNRGHGQLEGGQQ
jgi:hypothetical protein